MAVQLNAKSALVPVTPSVTPVKMDIICSHRQALPKHAFLHVLTISRGIQVTVTLEIQIVFHVLDPIKMIAQDAAHPMLLL